MAARRTGLKRRLLQDSDSSGDERRYKTVAVRPPSDRDVVTTQQSGQLQENSSSDEDNQLASGSSVHAGGINRPAKMDTHNRLKQNFKGQRSSNSPRTPSSDAKHHVTRTQLRKRTEEKVAVNTKVANNTKVADTKTRKYRTTREGPNSRLKGKIRGERSSQSQQGERREENNVDRKLGKSHTTRGVPKSAETKQVDDVAGTVSIMDSLGQELQPGDVVIKNFMCKIYVGDMDVVWCEARCYQVKKEKLTMPFTKAPIIGGSCHIYTPRERVARAESWVGTTFMLGDGKWELGREFLAWVCTGLPYYEASRRSFALK